jgi:threonine dehydratase
MQAAPRQAGANAMAISLARGRRTTLAKVDAFADGVAVKTVRHTTCPLPCCTVQHQDVCIRTLAFMTCGFAEG